jgi:hypothetical protein
MFNGPFSVRNMLRSNRKIIFDLTEEEKNLPSKPSSADLQKPIENYLDLTKD